MALEGGGTYVYARRQLGPIWGYLAGWGFVVGKTASCVALASVIIAGWSSSTTTLARITPLDTSPAGVLRAAGFLFFAFAGYARIATLGEEVRDPATTIPKAIPRALAGVLVIYAAVGVTVLASLPVAAISASDAPLGLVVSTSPFDWLTPIVRVGAGIAALGVLLNLIPGVSRTVLAMARRPPLRRSCQPGGHRWLSPTPLAGVGPRVCCEGRCVGCQFVATEPTPTPVALLS